MPMSSVMHIWCSPYWSQNPQIYQSPVAACNSHIIAIGNWIYTENSNIVGRKFSILWPDSEIYKIVMKVHFFCTQWYIEKFCKQMYYFCITYYTHFMLPQVAYYYLKDLAHLPLSKWHWQLDMYPNRYRHSAQNKRYIIGFIMREKQTLNQQQQSAASLKMCLTIFIHTHYTYIMHT